MKKFFKVVDTKHFPIPRVVCLEHPRVAGATSVFESLIVADIDAYGESNYPTALRAITEVLHLQTVGTVRNCGFSLPVITTMFRNFVTGMIMPTGRECRGVSLDSAIRTHMFYL